MFVNSKSKLPLMAALFASAAISSASLADIGPVVFRVDAEYTDGQGLLHSGFFEAPFDISYWNPVTQEYDWQLPAQIVIRDENGQMIAGIGSAGVYCREDPQVDLNFSVFAGSINTTFTITSPFLSFASIASAQGRTSAGFSISDLDGDGVSLSDWNGNSIYTSRYNGNVPGGTVFHDHFSGTYGTAVPFDSFSISEDFPGGGMFSPIGPAVSDMSSRFRFTLSANDIASGTSVYEIVPIPAPASVTLLGLGGILVARRRR
ncbi:MAG: hypothetical protein AB7G11_10425 [Phycisphaerales bacterium]